MNGPDPDPSLAPAPYQVPGGPQVMLPPWLAPSPPEMPPIQAPQPAEPQPAPATYAAPTQAPPLPAGATPQQRESDAETRARQATQQGQAAIGEQAQAEEAKGSLAQQQGREIAGEYLRRNQALYGAPNAKTGKPEGGLFQDREQQTKLDAAELGKRQDSYDKAVSSEANYKIDDNRRWNDLGTGKKILAAISIALSGIGDAFARRSGPNMALEMIQGAIKDDVTAQMREREEMRGRIGIQKNSIDNYRQLTNDKQSAFNLKVAEEYRRTADQIEADAAKYQGPLAKQSGMVAAAELRKQAATLSGSAAQADWQRANTERQSQQQMQMHRETLGQQSYQFGAQMAQQKQFHDDEVSQRAAQLERDGQATQAAALRKEQADLGEKGVMTPDGEYIKNKDGSFYKLPEKSAEKVHEQYSGAMQMIDALDQLRQLRHEQGGSINQWSADARAKAQEYERALIGAHKAAGIAGFRGNVMEVMDKMLSGGGDPNSVLQSLMDNLEQSRTDAVQDLNTTLHAHNYNGKALEFPDPLKAPPTPESQEKTLLRPTTRIVPEGGEAASLRPLTEADTAAARRSHEAGMFGPQLETFDKLDAMLRSDDPQQQQQASDLLVKIANEGATKEMKRYAQAMLARRLVPAKAKEATAPGKYTPPAINVAEAGAP